MWYAEASPGMVKSLGSKTTRVIVSARQPCKEQASTKVCYASAEGFVFCQKRVGTAAGMATMTESSVVAH